MRKTKPLVIELPRRQWQRYKRLALKTPNEVLVFLVGHNDPDRIEIVDFVYPAQRATPDAVEWTPQDIVKLQAQILPLEVVGTLHSHPGCEPHISKADVDTATHFGEVVFGVFSWWRPEGQRRRRMSLDFYYGPTAPITHKLK